MLSSISKYHGTFLTFLLPVIVFAQDREGSGSGSSSYTLTGIFSSIFDLINNILVPLMVSTALLLFFFGIVRYFFSQGSIAKEEARKFLFWGVTALFVMTAVWGIIGVLTNFIGIKTVVPQLPTGTVRSN